MGFHTIEVKTGHTTELIDISSQIRGVVAKDGIQNGLCTVFCSHTTGAITINENADPAVKRDLIMELNKVVPFEDGYTHLEGNSAAHLKSTLTGASEVIPIHQGRLVLGTWQGIYFCEYDGPRSRTVYVQIIGS